MREVAAGVWQLGGFPPNVINVYLIGDVLIDAGTRFARRRILQQAVGAKALALTHAHPDHQGSMHAVCSAWGVPLWVGAADAEAAEDPQLMARRMPAGPIGRLTNALFRGPGHPVARRLFEGDEIAGFVVLEVPGHTAGHLAFWRAGDGVLILGDVLNNMNLLTTWPGLHEPPASFTADPARNRDSARRLAALRPKVALFGHGPPLRDPDRLARFVDQLP